MDSKLKVTIPQGTLQGTHYKSILNGFNCCAFLGIPYAEVPIKDLRFKPPVPLERWNGILDASKEKEACKQYTFIKQKVYGSEDCLHLNVFTPEPPQDIKKLKAVIVHIHFGANLWGSNSVLSAGAPDFIVHHDVVYVIMNYRLHAFGFLNLNIPECTGNMGLKDQVLALKWVQGNIKYFGGDPNNVTLIGSSSGATALHYHLMSPMSRGLFHKAILQSGYGLSPGWSIMEDPIGTAFEFGRFLGFRGKDVESLYSFLKEASSDKIIEAIGELRAFDKKSDVVRMHFAQFLPSVEIFSEGAFLSQSPVDLFYDTISIPMICSQCEFEGIALFLAGSPEEIERAGLKEVIKKNLWFYKMSDETLNYVTNQIHSFYFGSEKHFSRQYDKLLDLYSDLFVCEWQSMIDFQSQKADVYAYLFTFQGELSFQRNYFFKIFTDYVNGSFHAEDMAHFAYLKECSGEIKRKEKIVVGNMGTMLTNFAKFGKPNHKKINWIPHTPENPTFLKFDVSLEVKKGIIKERRATFWKELIKYIRSHDKNADKSME